jgi:hypothetical protein
VVADVDHDKLRPFDTAAGVDFAHEAISDVVADSAPAQ